MFFSTLILAASLAQAPAPFAVPGLAAPPCPTCPRVQPVSAPIYVNNPPAAPLSVPQRMAPTHRQPVRTLLRAVFGRCR